MKKPVYLDYHATTPCDPAVLAEMMPYFGAEKFGNPDARTNIHGRNAAEALRHAKSDIAGLIGGDAEDVILASGATEANNLVLQGVASGLKNGRNEILVSAIEHDSVFNARMAGIEVKKIPVTRDGFIDPGVVASMTGDRTLMVSVMAANHEIGTIQPIKQIATIARASGALFHTDATQAAGKIPLDAEELRADFITFSAHKMYGPAGIGALYAAPERQPLISRIFFGGEQQKSRPGTVPLALAAGFAAACRLAIQKMPEEEGRLKNLGNLFLEKMPDVKINGALSPRLPGSFNICLPGINAEQLLLNVSAGLSMATGSACASAARKPSHVLRAIGLSEEDIFSSIRFSFGRYTTQEDVIFAAETIACL